MYNVPGNYLPIIMALDNSRRSLFNIRTREGREAGIRRSPRARECRVCSHGDSQMWLLQRTRLWPSQTRKRAGTGLGNCRFYLPIPLLVSQEGFADREFTGNLLGISIPSHAGAEGPEGPVPGPARALTPFPLDAARVIQVKPSRGSVPKRN